MKSLKKPGRVKAALLDWLGVPIDLMNEDFWKYFGNQNVAGQVINEKTVMQLSAVWSCVRLIAETISTLPLQIYKRTDGGRVSASDHPLYSIIHTQPNANSTASVFWEAMITAMLMGGNAVAEPKYIGQKLVALNFLNPCRLSCSRINGKRVWRYTNSDGTQRTLTDAQVFRIPGFTLDGDWGVSSIVYGSGVFGSALAAANASNSTFEKGMLPTVAFSLPGKLNPKDRDDFRDMIKRISGALNAGESPVLEHGMTAAPLGINPVDAQLLESRNFSVEEICRWFRVPPFMVGHTTNSTSWGTGIEQQMIGFLTFTLRPWLTRIEQAINMNLLSPADQLKYYAEFSVEGLLRADSAGRAAFYKTMVDGGIETRDEVREKENLPPMGGNAAVLTVNSATMPLDKIGQTQPKVPTNET
jgi:HK97 family phage portal protein